MRHSAVGGSMHLSGPGRQHFGWLEWNNDMECLAVIMKLKNSAGYWFTKFWCVRYGIFFIPIISQMTNVRWTLSTAHIIVWGNISITCHLLRWWWLAVHVWLHPGGWHLTSGSVVGMPFCVCGLDMAGDETLGDQTFFTCTF